MVVVEHEVAADGADLGGILHAEAPAHFVDALVADVAVAVFPVPMPVVVEAVFGERPFGRRAEPQVVMNAGGRGFVGCAADRVAPLEAETARHVHVTDDAFAQFADRFAQGDGRTAVGSMLHDAVVLACSSHQLRAFPDGMEHGFSQ